MVYRLYEHTVHELGIKSDNDKSITMQVNVEQWEDDHHIDIRVQQ